MQHTSAIGQPKKFSAKFPAGVDTSFRFSPSTHARVTSTTAPKSIRKKKKIHLMYALVSSSPLSSSTTTTRPLMQTLIAITITIVIIFLRAPHKKQKHHHPNTSHIMSHKSTPYRKGLFANSLFLLQQLEHRVPVLSCAENGERHRGDVCGCVCVCVQAKRWCLLPEERRK